MYSLVPGVRLIHYWNKENEQCLAKICMRTVNITIYHAKVRGRNEEEKCSLPEKSELVGAAEERGAGSVGKYPPRAK